MELLFESTFLHLELFKQTIMAHVYVEYAEHTILQLFVHLSRAALANDFEIFVHVALFEQLFTSL